MTAESHDEAIARIIQDICDLDDYTTPEDQPDLLQCTVSQLTAILQNRLAIVPTGGAYAEAVLSDVTPAEIERAADVWDKFRGHVIVADGLRHIFREFIANRRASIPDASEAPSGAFTAGMRRAAEIVAWGERSKDYYSALSTGDGEKIERAFARQQLAEEIHYAILAAIPAAPAPEGEIEAALEMAQEALEAVDEHPGIKVYDTALWPKVTAARHLVDASLASIRSRPAEEPPAFYDNPDEEVQGRRAIEQSDPRNNPAAEPPGCPIPGEGLASAFERAIAKLEAASDAKALRIAQADFSEEVSAYADDFLAALRAAEAQREVVEALRPFARAAQHIPNDAPDGLWTSCDTYEFDMPEDTYNALLAEGVPLKSRRQKVSLWIDGHPVKDFRRARAALSRLADAKSEKGA